MQAGRVKTFTATTTREAVQSELGCTKLEGGHSTSGQATFLSLRREMKAGRPLLPAVPSPCGHSGDADSSSGGAQAAHSQDRAQADPAAPRSSHDFSACDPFLCPSLLRPCERRIPLPPHAAAIGSLDDRFERREPGRERAELSQEGVQVSRDGRRESDLVFVRRGKRGIGDRVCWTVVVLLSAFLIVLLVVIFQVVLRFG